MLYASYAVGVLILVVLPPFLPVYFQGIMTKILIFAMAAMSLDIVFGYAGLWSLGHAAFFGSAAYTVGILIIRCGINSFLVCCALAIFVTGLIAVIFGFVALRGRGVYFLILTLALGQLTFSVAWRWTTLTGGDGGMHPIPALMEATSFYYVVLSVFLAYFIIIYRLINSPFGGAIQGIRDSESRMRCLGYNTWVYKYIAFITAGLFAGIAGVFFAYYNGTIVPDHVGLSTSALLMIMVMLGGAGTLFGPVFGAALIIILEQVASIYMPQRWPLILGAIFVICAMVARGGLWLELVKLRNSGKPKYGGVKS